MPPKKIKSTDSLSGLYDELENLNMDPVNRGSMSSYPSVSSMSSNMSSLNSSRRNSPANELMNSIIDDDTSEVSNKAVVAPKRIKPKKTQRKSAKTKKTNKSAKKRGGRTPKEVYYKYSPNTGKRIRMTTNKKK